MSIPEALDNDSGAVSTSESRWVPQVLLFLAALATASFVCLFEPERNSWSVNASWLVAVGFWLYAIRRHERVAGLRAPRVGAGRYSLRPAAPLFGFLLLVAVVWIPFHDNWRWVGAGDSFPWFDLPRRAAEHGLEQSLFSVRGPYNLFTYTQSIVDNILMFIFEPSFFWHRASKLLISLIALAAIFAFFVLHVGRYWAMLVVMAVSTHFLWINMSYLSFSHMDGFIYAYSMLALTTMIFRKPERVWWWAMAGLVAGLAVFFTQTSWAEVSACCMVISVLAIHRRQWNPLVVFVGTGVVTALPLLLQLGEFLHLQSGQSKAVWNLRYLGDIFWRTLTLPLGASPHSLDPNGYLFFWPFGCFYVAGFTLAVAYPIVRLWHRRGPGVFLPISVGLLLWGAALLTGSNNGYPHPSWKRTYHFIPLFVWLGIVPIWSVEKAMGNAPVLRRAVRGCALCAVVAFAAGNLWIFASPPVRNGGNIVDGLVQVHQRFGDTGSIVIDQREAIRDLVADPASILNRAYAVQDGVEVTAAVSGDDLARLCAAGGVICFYPNDPENGEIVRAAAAERRLELQGVTLHNVGGLQCRVCAGRGAGGRSGE